MVKIIPHAWEGGAQQCRSWSVSCRCWQEVLGLRFVSSCTKFRRQDTEVPGKEAYIRWHTQSPLYTCLGWGIPGVVTLFSSTLQTATRQESQFGGIVLAALALVWPAPRTVAVPYRTYVVVADRHFKEPRESAPQSGMSPREESRSAIA